MPRHLPRSPLPILLGAAVIVVAALAACDAEPFRSGALAPTLPPNIIYVTATPEGYSAPETPLPPEPVGQPSPTPYVVYVTATPEGAATPTATPYVIYITATPLVVGPFHATEAPGEPPAVAPTLDLSRLTQVPTRTPGPTTTPGPTPTATATPLIPQPREGALYSNRLGINFIGSAHHQADGERFRMGIDAGAGWDRFAIYWNEIEQEPNNYRWRTYDVVVRNDVINGLRTDAILIGIPDIYAGGDKWIPGGIFEPVFADGSDEPGDDKEINPDNPWAEFVYTAVMRYKPGGKLATRERWPRGAGIRVWEIWNEPDFRQFWHGDVNDYARLLKVAYLAIRHADPDAKVMIGGLVLFEQPSFVYDLLAIYQNDPEPVDRRYPFDAVAVHSYSQPAFSFVASQQLETLLATHGLNDVEVWVNESGVTVWDDYPGPTWASRADQVQWRATMQEQASYVLQNAAFTFLGEAAKLFHFQLYDDCGNQPAGTTFAPHDGSLCDGGNVCWGDALGLVRNREDNVCFNQHPEPGTQRPAYDAFRLVGELFGNRQTIPLTGYTSGGRQWMIFALPETGEIMTIIWDETGQAGEVVVRPRADQGQVIRLNGERQIVTPAADGAYHLWLDPATNRNQPGNPGFMIGGPPVVLIEKSTQPIVTVLPLLDVSRTAALVKWRSSDPSITQYEIYYRDDTSGANEWVPWIQTDQPGEQVFAAGIGRSYSFFARGLKPDGTWTADVPYAQAWTTLQ